MLYSSSWLYHTAVHFLNHIRSLVLVLKVALSDIPDNYWLEEAILGPISPINASRAWTNLNSSRSADGSHMDRDLARLSNKKIPQKYRMKLPL